MRALPHAPRAARPRRPGQRAPVDGPARRLGRRPGPAARRARATAACRPRSSTTRSPPIDYAPEDSAGIVLGIARYHRDSNGWNDIGYNFLVDRYGVIFEGRAGGIEAAVIGAQAQGYNSDSTGIACLGTFTNLPLDAPAMESLARLIGWKLSLHGVPVAGPGDADLRRRREQPLPERHAGHLRARQRPPRRRPDLLPRRALYAQLPDLRARAARYAFAVSAHHGQRRQPEGRAARSASPARCASPTAPRPRARRSASSTRRPGSAWTQVTTTACGPDGAWATSVALPASGQVRAVFAGDATRGRLESAPVAVKVVPSLTLTSDKRRAQGRHARSRSPARWPRRSRAVVCLLERQVGSRWVTVQRKRINVRGGRFATKVRPKTPGLYRVSIIADGVTRRRTLRALR